MADQADREFWTIGAMSKAFDATPRALRFYEDKGLLAPKREGLNRLYTSRDRARLKLILRGKRIGLPLDDIRDILNLYDLKDGQQLQMRKSLEKFQAHAVLLRQQRADLDESIATLEERIGWLEEQLAKPASPVDGADAYAARAMSALAEDTLEFSDGRTPRGGTTAAGMTRTAARQ